MELDKDHLTTVYDPNGVPHRVSRLDALEYLASGHYTTTSPAKVDDGKVAAPEVKPADAAKPEVAAPGKADRKTQVG